MNDCEVALELLKIALEKSKAKTAVEKDPCEYVLELYRKCLATVRSKE